MIDMEPHGNSYYVEVNEETLSKLSWIARRIDLIESGEIPLPAIAEGNIILLDTLQLPEGKPTEVKSITSTILNPIIDDIKLFGMVDRTLSEMKYLLDHPGDFDMATFQTMKHHLEDMDLFMKYAVGKLTSLGVIKSLPPVAEQKVNGF